MKFNLADLFEQVSDAAGDRTAMVSGPRRLTYAELDARANRLAHHLEAAGIGPADRVGLQLVNGTEYIEGMLACFKVRAVPVNVNYRYVAGELAHLYGDAGLVGLVYDRRFAPAVAGALGTMPERRVLVAVGRGPDDADGGSEGPAEVDGTIDYEACLQGSPPDRGFPPRSADDLYCVYTGGTTGMPKGVLWRHEDIFFAAMGGGDPLSLGDHIATPSELAGRILASGIVALAIPPFMHASGHWLAFSTMFGGGTIVTLPDGRFDPSEVWRLVGAEAVSVVVVVGDAMARPLIEELAARRDRYDVSSLMACGSGGAVLSPSTKARLSELLPGVIVADLFGSSETGQVGGEAPSGDPFGAPRLRVDDRTTVLDESLHPVAAGSGAVGRLARTGHIPLGYQGDPRKTAATFAEAGGRRWVMPGDLARIESDGTIVVLGRGSLCINTGGEKVYPDEVESTLKDHPDVADVVVVGVPDERFGERVVAVVEARRGRVVDADDLRSLLRGRLTGYKIPRQVVTVPSIVRSPSGKADYPWARSVAREAPWPAEVTP
ncbi:MAG: acyl-CoA synthetase [Acidimicrobiales bacterium]